MYVRENGGWNNAVPSHMLNPYTTVLTLRHETLSLTHLILRRGVEPDTDMNSFNERELSKEREEDEQRYKPCSSLFRWLSWLWL